MKVDCCIALPAGIVPTKCRENPTFITEVNLLEKFRNFESKNWNLPGSLTRLNSSIYKGNLGKVNTLDTFDNWGDLDILFGYWELRLIQ